MVRLLSGPELNASELRAFHFETPSVSRQLRRIVPILIGTIASVGVILLILILISISEKARFQQEYGQGTRENGKAAAVQGATTEYQDRWADILDILF